MLRPKISLFACLFLALILMAAIQKDTAWLQQFDGKGASQPDLPATVIIPASDFLYEIPKGDIIADAGTLKADWIFNNTALVLKSETNLLTKVQVPEAGQYFLYVRSQGEPKSSFKVVLNDKVTSEVFGNGPLTWRKGGPFNLKAGTNVVKITRIDTGSAFDVLVLSKEANLTEEAIKPFQLNKNVKLLKEYKVPAGNAVKFGDVTGDGQTDFMAFKADFSAHVFDNNGQELWNYAAPEAYRKERSEFEAPGVIWDFDRDGKAEVVHWRFLDGKEWLVIADGRTGKIKRKTEWPTKPLPHVYNNFRLAIAKLIKGDPNQLVVYTDMGGTVKITAYNSELKQLWEHTENRKKDNLGHYIYPIDLNKDGIDEVLVGSLLLDAKGKKIWDRFDLLNDNHDHADSYKFGDVDGDGQLDIAASNSETGVFIYKALTGEIIWQNTAEHSQQIQVGDFLPQVPGTEVVVGARTYGNRQAGEPYLSSQLYWFDNKGELLRKWPGQPINGNPDFVKGNWKGDGKDELFWFKFRLNNSGAGEFYFPDPVYHMFDFMGKGAEEVITLSRGTLRVYGYSQAEHSNKDSKQNRDYLRNAVTNHTHY